MEKKFRIKFIIVIILVILNLLGLGYLQLKPSSSAPAKPQESEPAETVNPETPDTAAPEETTPVPVVWMPEIITAIRNRAASAAAEPATEPASEPEPVPEPEPVKPEYDFSSVTSIQKIVNKDSRLDETYKPSDLVIADVTKDYDEYLRQEAADALKMMFDAAAADGTQLLLIDGYRSYSEQRSLYYTYLERYGSSTVATMDAHPGASEHQLGLAVDLGDLKRSCNLRSCFVDTSAYSWLKDNAWKYGWIERYPYGKTNITGINFSPWHYRYVGTDLARDLYESGLTLEEYTWK